MEAFISYSHKDETYLDLFHRHLAQLKRDGLIQTWTDQKILAGGMLNEEISHSLGSAQIFIALLSPDYINSNYCYEKEFETAMTMQAQKTLTIVPVILEPCDWKNTPFAQYKALPKDGKPVSDWSNENNAMLDVIQKIRKLVSGYTVQPTSNSTIPSSLPTNYKVEKDFDSLQKMDFLDEGFGEMKELLNNNIKEINQIENIVTRVLINNDEVFEAIIVNRNKIKAESTIKITKGNLPVGTYVGFGSLEHSIACIFDNATGQNNIYGVSWDEFDLFWIRQNYHYQNKNEKLSIVEMVDEIWSSWLEKVGIFN